MVDRICRQARVVHESVGGEKFFVISLTDSVLQQDQNGEVLTLRNRELTFAPLSGFNKA